CLCGSELHTILGQLNGDFLSCLCGSELDYGWRTICLMFLSCLCGSEQLDTNFNLLIIKG
ncbi:hypothetical protein, partial [Photorhabdus luminescens]|uniref:hypothetical protein n=1 Tax=Photorhabdus luminescens TaxID=29488 RepID=UPI001C405A30